MQIKKYFSLVVFIFGLLFFSINFAQAAGCKVSPGGAVADCCNDKITTAIDCGKVGGSWLDDCGMKCSTPVLDIGDPKKLTSSGTMKFGNPLGTVDTIDGLLGSILTAAKNVVVILAIIAIVVGGIMYIFAGVNEGMVKAGKSAITYALIGLAVVVAAPSFLKEIINVLGGNMNCTPVNGVTPAGCITATAQLTSALTFTKIATNILNLLLSIVGLLGIIGLVLGGTAYLTAYGDPKKAEKGKTIAQYSLIGILIALSAMILVKQIAKLIAG
jgi:hypothetical protein